ncbi:SAMP protein, partial [Atractosteus spatula]|nr:SAMP protein [Atractosteus spatula]
MAICDKSAVFWGLPGDLNEWNSICATWDSSTGLSQVWVNGKAGSRKGLGRGRSLTDPSIILGQEQDAYSGGFNTNDAFTGQVTDVHMWAYVLSPCEIHDFMNGVSFKPGDIINWQALQYTTSGYVAVENKPNTSINACYNDLSRCSRV